MQQLYIVHNYLRVLARRSKSEYIILDSEIEIKAGCIVIYLPRQWRHLWITIANVKLCVRDAAVFAANIIHFCSPNNLYKRTIYLPSIILFTSHAKSFVKPQLIQARASKLSTDLLTSR